MKKEGVIIFREILVVQMNHWILLPVAMTAHILIYNLPLTLGLWILCSLIPFAMFLVRRYTNHFLIYAISHLAMLGIFLVFPVGLAEKLFLTAYVIGYTVNSLYLRLKTKHRLDNPLHPSISIASTGVSILILNYSEKSGWEVYYMVPLAIFMGLYFLQFYLKQYLNFLLVNDSSTGHIPQKEIFLCGIKPMLLFSTGAILLLMLISNFAWIQPFVSFLRMLLIAILRLFIGNKETPTDVQILEDPVLPQTGKMDFLPIEAETFWLWVVLEKVVFVAFGCAVVGVILFILYLWIKTLYEGFRDRTSIKGITVDSVNDKRERCEVDKQKKEKKAMFVFLGPKERIRKIYKKEVWSNRMQLTGEGRPEQLERLTADECGKVLNRVKMTECYEKARYSDAECTAEDVRLARAK